MKRFILSDLSLLIADILILLICAGGFYLITIKADLPFKTSNENSSLIVAEVYGTLIEINPGDKIASIDNYHFENWEEAELYLDSKRIGDNANLKLEKNDSIFFTTVKLTNYYSIFNLIIIALVGITFFVMGVFVRIKAPDNKSAQLFHWAMVGLAMIITITAGYYNIKPSGYGHINRVFWLIVYSITPVLFIHFTSSFAKKKVKSIKYILWYFYVSAIINSAILSYLFIDATIGRSLQSSKYYVAFFDSFFRLFLVTCIIIAISICIYAYRSSGEIEERRRLQWLLLGFFIGPMSFVIFWVIPIYLTGYSLIPEALILVFLIAIPITFSIAIVKYHLMNINLIVRRSVVYTIILVMVIITYILIAALITFFVSDINFAIPSIITALFVVAALQPVKTSIQKFVDKKFFRVEYDFRVEQNKFLEDIKGNYDINSLANLIVTRTDNLIPVEKIGFFELNGQTKKIMMVANKGWDKLTGRSIRFEPKDLKTDLSTPVAVDNRVEPGLKIESADVKVFRHWGMVLVFPIKSPGEIIHGLLVLGEKKSDKRFYKDDIDLLNTITTAAALAISRIKLQEELIKEQLKAQRLEEIKNLQSFFVSAITHELRTPLQAIKSFAELLQNKRFLIKEKLLEYSHIIECESDKLSGLIDNILDYQKIEKGDEIYEKSFIEVNSVIRKTVKSMQYQFNMHKQYLKEKISSEEVFINADPNAIELAVLNLLTNALKYSHQNSTTELHTLAKDGLYYIKVKDEGKGIEKENLDKIFEAFFRIKGETAKGTGIGLALVKHIMDVHNGKIEVESKFGKGSTFTLLFYVEAK